jgi:hypothetical protein
VPILRQLTDGGGAASDYRIADVSEVRLRAMQYQRVLAVLSSRRRDYRFLAEMGLGLGAAVEVRVGVEIPCPGLFHS